MSHDRHYNAMCSPNPTSFPSGINQTAFLGSLKVRYGLMTEFQGKKCGWKRVPDLTFKASWIILCVLSSSSSGQMQTIQWRTPQSKGIAEPVGWGTPLVVGPSDWEHPWRLQPEQGINFYWVMSLKLGVGCYSSYPTMNNTPPWCLLPSEVPTTLTKLCE